MGYPKWQGDSLLCGKSPNIGSQGVRFPLRPNYGLWATLPSWREASTQRFSTIVKVRKLLNFYLYSTYQLSLLINMTNTSWWKLLENQRF